MADWIDVGHVDEVPARGARRINIMGVPVGVFKSHDGAVFALLDECPHKKGRLSDGIVHGRAVACPLHNWNIDLATGEAMAPDKGCTAVIEIKVAGGRIHILADSLPAAQAA